jgi:hypothetical protein
MKYKIVFAFKTRGKRSNMSSIEVTACGHLWQILSKVKAHKLILKCRRKNHIYKYINELSKVMRIAVI